MVITHAFFFLILYCINALSSLSCAFGEREWKKENNKIKAERIFRKKAFKHENIGIDWKNYTHRVYIFLFSYKVEIT